MNNACRKQLLDCNMDLLNLITELDAITSKVCDIQEAEESECSEEMEEAVNNLSDASDFMTEAVKLLVSVVREGLKE